MDKLLCSVCNKELKWVVADASMNRFRKLLCIEHQIEEVRNKWSKQPELQKRKIEQLKKYLGLGDE